MPYPRVMGDAVLLPDGTVFITNGGGVGTFIGLSRTVWQPASDLTSRGACFTPVQGQCESAKILHGQ